MFCQIALGFLAGAATVKLLRHRRHCHGWGGHGWRGHGFGHGRGRHLFWLLRDLGLDGQQRTELRSIWSSVSQAFGSLRFERFQSIQDLLDAAASEPLDTARLDELAARHAESHANAAKQITAAVARVHEILRPEQRAKLRRHLAQWGWHAGPPAAGPAGPGDGPYRV